MLSSVDDADSGCLSSHQFYTEVHRSTVRLGTVNDSCRNDDCLPRIHLDRPSIRKVDEQLALDHQRELVRMGVTVPLTGPLHHNEPQTMVIDLGEHLVAISLSDCSTFFGEIKDLERRKSNGLLSAGATISI